MEADMESVLKKRSYLMDKRDFKSVKELSTERVCLYLDKKKFKELTDFLDKLLFTKSTKQKEKPTSSSSRTNLIANLNDHLTNLLLEEEYACHALGKFERALVISDAVLSTKFIAKKEFYDEKVKCLGSLGRLQEAFDFALETVATTHNSLYLQKFLGKFYEDNGNLLGALKCYLKALELVRSSKPIDNFEATPLEAKVEQLKKLVPSGEEKSAEEEDSVLETDKKEEMDMDAILGRVSHCMDIKDFKDCKTLLEQQLRFYLWERKIADLTEFLNKFQLIESKQCTTTTSFIRELKEDFTKLLLEESSNLFEDMMFEEALAISNVALNTQFLSSDDFYDEKVKCLKSLGHIHDAYQFSVEAIAAGHDSFSLQKFLGEYYEEISRHVEASTCYSKALEFLKLSKPLSCDEIAFLEDKVKQMEQLVLSNAGS